MIDPNKVTEAVTEFMQNPTWKDIFMNAPGGAMERLAISFYFSKFHDQFQPEDFQEYRDLRDEYEKSMTEEDLNYLIENSDKENAIKHYQELLSKIQGGQQPTGTLRFEKEETAATEGEGSEDQTETTEAEAEQTEETNGGEEQTATEAVLEGQEEPQSEGDTETPPEGEPPSEEQKSVSEAKSEEATSEEGQGDGKEEQEGDEESGEEGQKLDEKYDTALSVALNYLQNEKKKQ